MGKCETKKKGKKIILLTEKRILYYSGVNTQNRDKILLTQTYAAVESTPEEEMLGLYLNLENILLNQWTESNKIEN